MLNKVKITKTMTCTTILSIPNEINEAHKLPMAKHMMKKSLLIISRIRHTIPASNHTNQRFCIILSIIAVKV